MINRLVPAGISLCFGAKKKLAPGEISRVKTLEEKPQEKLERTPKTDTFTAANTNDMKSDFANTQIPHSGRNKQSDK